MVGSFDPCSTCRAMTSSLNSVKLSARQYHCKPGTYKPSNRLCTAGNGAGPIWSRSGWPTERIDLVDSSVCSEVPVQHQIIPQTFLRWRCAGNAGAGGTTRKAKKAAHLPRSFLDEVAIGVEDR